MNSKKKNFLDGLKKRIVIWIIAFLFSYIFIYLIDPFSYKELLHKPFLYIIEDIFWIFLFSIIIAEVSLFIDYCLDKKISWQTKSSKRLITQTLLQIVGSIVIVIIINEV